MKKIFQIINLKTLIISGLSVVSTAACIEYNITADFPLPLIATAIIFPIVFSINGAYKRREAQGQTIIPYKRILVTEYVIITIYPRLRPQL